MWALETPHAPRPGPILAGTPRSLLAVLTVGWLGVVGLAAAGRLPGAAVGVASITLVHGGLLGVALAWAAMAGAPGPPRRACLITIGLVAAGATAAAVGPPGALVYLAVPAWLGVLAMRGRLRGLGLGPGIPPRAVAAGAAIGALLGGHLLFSAAQTLGHPLRGGGWGALLGFWGYDVGANILSAEVFFRGALFNRLQRRWSFTAAAAAATALALVRYLVDPLLPRHIEVLAGALFYLTILGAVDCWLLWWSGSLVPGLVASVLFFLAYRAVAIG